MSDFQILLAIFIFFLITYIIVSKPLSKKKHRTFFISFSYTGNTSNNDYNGMDNIVITIPKKLPDDYRVKFKHQTEEFLFIDYITNVVNKKIRLRFNSDFIDCKIIHFSEKFI